MLNENKKHYLNGEKVIISIINAYVNTSTIEFNHDTNLLL